MKCLPMNLLQLENSPRNSVVTRQKLRLLSVRQLTAIAPSYLNALSVTVKMFYLLNYLKLMKITDQPLNTFTG